MLAVLNEQEENMAMTTPEAALFDADKYADARLRTPEMLGKKTGVFLNLSRFITVDMEEGVHEIFVREEQAATFTSEGYADKDVNFKKDFIGWKITKSHQPNYEGFLAGFPRITDPDGRYKDCLHMWENNSSVMDATYAIPLTAIKGLYVFSKLRTDLMVDLDELAMGDVGSRYEIPMIRNKKTGEVHYRDAEYEDIENIVESMNELPVCVFGVGRIHRTHRVVDDEFLKNLLDD